MLLLRMPFLAVLFLAVLCPILAELDKTKSAPLLPPKAAVSTRGAVAKLITLEEQADSTEATQHEEASHSSENEGAELEESTEAEEGEEFAEAGAEEHGGEGHEGEEGEEEEEEEIDLQDLTGAFFLLGGVTFVMSLFYTVNHPDKEMQLHSWKVISATVSIFVAVLLFQGLNGVLDMLFERMIREHHEHLQRGVKIGLAYAQFFVFYCTMHVILASYAYMEPSAKDDSSFGQQRKLKMACWATLFAHMSGFAVIRCVLELQETPLFQVGAMNALPTLINLLFLFLVFRLMDFFRSHEPYYKKGASNEGYLRWEEGAEEAENDVAAISLSFSAVAVLRFIATGMRSNGMGLALPVTDHPTSAKVMIGVAGALTAFLAIAIILVYAQIESRKGGAHAPVDRHNTHGFDHINSYVTRWVFIASATFATMSSWCAMFVCKWCLHSFMVHLYDESNPNGCIQRVILAMLVSFFSFGCVYFLDKLQDLDATGDAADQAIGEVINAIGVMVGFCWEQSFDAGVEVVGELTHHWGPTYPVLSKLVLAIIVAIVMIPAWRKHFLRKVLEDRSHCSCGAIFFADASYCHMCGKAHPGPQCH